MNHITRYHTAWIAAAACVCIIFSLFSVGHRRSATGPVTITYPPASTNTRPVQSTRTSSGAIYVHVTGMVARPGLYRFPAGARVMDAVSNAGGATVDADLSALNLATPLQDGQRLTVPGFGEGAPSSPDAYLTDSPPSGPPIELIRPEAPSSPTEQATAAGVDAALNRAVDSFAVHSSKAVHKISRPEEGHVNVNTASLGELQRLPGVGPSTAAKILEYRETNGSFQTVQELMEVKGIGPAKLRKMQSFVVVSGR